MNISIMDIGTQILNKLKLLFYILYFTIDKLSAFLLSENYNINKHNIFVNLLAFTMAKVKITI